MVVWKGGRGLDIKITLYFITLPLVLPERKNQTASEVRDRANKGFFTKLIFTESHQAQYFKRYSDVKKNTTENVTSQPSVAIQGKHKEQILDYAYNTPDRLENGEKLKKRGCVYTGADFFENVTFTVATRARYAALCKHRRRFFLCRL